eukprot:7860454-Prorocentrum_lima.AAC.1
MLTQQHELVPYADAAKRLTFTEVIDLVQNHPQLAQASGWVSALGGTKAGVYLLYGRPDCDWKFTSR